jgi:1,2-dihydroxy-3-keto-5-methylthiopentene dioxygenase
MAVVYIPDLEKALTDFDEAKAHLASIGIGYERWDTSHISSETPAEEILESYAKEIDILKQQGGYVTADVVDVFPTTPNLDVMLNKFNREHTHSEDEVRFFLEGNGLFFVRPLNGAPVVRIEVGKGDLLRVPAGTTHWFDACENKRFRAIRLFQDPSGWTPYYTDTGVDKNYMPVCFGLQFIPSALQSI